MRYSTPLTLSMALLPLTIAADYLDRKPTYMKAIAPQITNAPVLSVLFPGADSDKMSVYASVVSANADTTSMYLTCAPDTRDYDCGLGGGASVAIISKTMYKVSMSHELWSFTMECNNAKPTAPVCTVDNQGEEANDPGVSTMTLEQEEIEDGVWMRATVTAGAEKLNVKETGAPAKTTGAGEKAQETGSSLVTKASGTSSGVKASKTASGEANASGSEAPKQTGGAVSYRAGGAAAALLAVAGVAMLL